MILEAVIARRLLYWAESRRLPSETQVGGRPGRSTEQALLVLVNAVGRTWLQLRSRAVTPTAFDLKGALNGVNKFSLETRLRSKGITMIGRRWINSFTDNRYASIPFDDFQKQPTRVEIAPPLKARLYHRPTSPSSTLIW